ncbi:Exosome non-catalytic core component [Coemansia sp. RSA 989]|nr:ribosomal protein S5 domain 2-type protein [Coemansia mojavensis]KAJ1750747.1 Exosome non-catalytic core component [Coemansia sp. RSA 1821]KAJ1865397.1 Exosome non-catalytic core component [Coemansia sp. RSA 989]KAJ2629358.1 Exosome non-catalytic core component [Coemansia sp. RSA 1290]KAJ2647588.1 Exosome non-catalytic core component [Coemansia sp. RSA 1250]KAJ2669513.1 Exosome non-catalytic core component [Coemansia sp. RSA 1085]
MSRQELLSPEGLRIDGRRANELRRIACRASVLNTADGSSYYEQGNTKVLVAVFGPREPRQRTTLQQHDQAIINVEFNVAPFSTSERRKRSKGDKRLLEISSFVRQTFEGAVQRSVYPRSQIDIYVHLLQHDGGMLEACVNAATLALVDAGISMDDYVCACTAGLVDEQPLLDLNGQEESAIAMPGLTVAVLPRSGSIALLQMESKMHATKLDDVMQLAIEGCKHIHTKLDEAVLAAANDLAVKLSNS